MSTLHRCLLIENATSLPAKLPSPARQGHYPHRVTQRKADEQVERCVQAPNARSLQSFQGGCVTIDSLGQICGDRLAYFHNEGCENDLLLCNCSPYVSIEKPRILSSSNGLPRLKKGTLHEEQPHFLTGSAARALFSLVGLVVLVLLAACGSNTSTGSTTVPNATSTTSAGSTPTSSGGRYGNGYGNGGTTPTVSSSGSLIQTATATVNGTSATILTTAKGGPSITAPLICLQRRSAVEGVLAPGRHCWSLGRALPRALHPSQAS